MAKIQKKTVKKCFSNKNKRGGNPTTSTHPSTTILSIKKNI